MQALPPVKSAANIMKQIVFSNRNHFSASLIVSGWDPYEGFTIHQINQTGFHTKGDYALGGSGSSYIIGYVDANYKQGMSKA